MKKAIVNVDCCRECPFAEKTKYPMLKLCPLQDEKEVRANEIDEGCPLEDSEH